MSSCYRSIEACYVDSLTVLIYKKECTYNCNLHEEQSAQHAHGTVLQFLVPSTVLPIGFRLDRSIPELLETTYTPLGSLILILNIFALSFVKESS